MTRHFLFSLLLLSAISVLVGCKSSRQAASASGWEQKASPGRPSDRPLPVPDKSLPSGLLIAEAESWLGVPYKYGGNDRKGVDCSGLVLQVYRQALDISMPRNSKAQKDFCTPAKTSELLPGDLVFFATGRDRSRVSHVGIYLGDNRMIHASTNGVVVSDITVPYYTRTFAGAGFVGQYRAMIDDAGRRKHDDNLAMADRKTKKKEKGKPRPEPESRPAPKPEPDPCPEPTEPLNP
ncbi:MAG: C40 family peptidase, partial [Duncaniella sp.]|nr:C40 family peptidase [Duncaniella sp.]